MQFNEFPLTIQKRKIREFVRETGKSGTNTDQGEPERKSGIKEIYEKRII